MWSELSDSLLKSYEIPRLQIAMHERIYTRAWSTRRWKLSVDDLVQVFSWLLGLLET